MEGTIELMLDREKKCFGKGERYYIPEGGKHYGRSLPGMQIVHFSTKQITTLENPGEAFSRKREKGSAAKHA